MSKFLHQADNIKAIAILWVFSEKSQAKNRGAVKKNRRLSRDNMLSPCDLDL